MPVKCEEIPPPSQSKQLGFPKTLLYNGSKFEGSQKSKGNSYAVEVVLQVPTIITYGNQTILYCDNNNLIIYLNVISACRWREFILVWLFEDHRTHIRVSHAHNILWRWNYFKKISIFNQEMGCWWRCRQKTLGMQQHFPLFFH